MNNGELQNSQTGSDRQFAAVIYLLGINPCVDVPKNVSRSFSRTGNIPVRGVLNDHPIRASLVPAGGGAHRLYINTAMRELAGVGVGDEVRLALEYDPLPRRQPVPDALARALNNNDRVREAFNRLTPSRRHEILAYLNSLKRPESIARNVDKVVTGLLNGGMEEHRPG